MYKYDKYRGGYYNDVNGIVAMARRSAHGDYNDPTYEIALKFNGEECMFRIYWSLIDDIGMDILRKKIGKDLMKLRSYPGFLIVKNGLFKFNKKEKINFLYKCGIIKNNIIEKNDIDLLIEEIKSIVKSVNHRYKCIILTIDSNISERDRSDIFCNIYISMHDEGLV